LPGSGSQRRGRVDPSHVVARDPIDWPGGAHVAFGSKVAQIEIARDPSLHQFLRSDLLHGHDAVVADVLGRDRVAVRQRVVLGDPEKERLAR
jgi:hypothetical protein